MSITNSLYIGVSGLLAHGEAISVVGDNVANTSTVGFKRERASFADLLGGDVGGQAAGGGVHLGPSQSMWGQGAITQTAGPLDVAINGGGMFVMKAPGGQAPALFTRDGRFRLDEQGFVVNAHGLRVQGYPVDSAGVRGTVPGDLPLGAQQSPPIATKTAALALNLDANAAVPPPFDPANAAATSSYATSVTVHDSLGAAHHVELYFRHQGAGAWEWHALADGGELAGGAPGTPTQIAAGTLSFDTAGKLSAQATLSSSASFKGATPNQVIAFDFGDDLASGGTGLTGTTQFSGVSTVHSVDVDGHAAGNLSSLEIGADGAIQGVYDNGERTEVARLALADFASYEGLERTGDGLWTATAASGDPLIDAPGTGRRGALVAGALEASNVDLGTELVTLIAYQRAFQANAKTVTTADEMMADINSLKR